MAAVVELYTQFNRVWIPDAEHVWRSAEISRDFHPGDNALHLRLEDGSELQYPVDTSRLPPLRNPDILVGENDLTALSYLHEAAVLHNIRVRFLDTRTIYTYCGIILVSVNPYKALHIYGDAVIQAYAGQNMGEMDPHIFAVAEEAYKQMARNHKNQSIIVSGESGAGKTVSARYAMRYFAVVSKSSSKTRVEEKVLASNPITEAIGNAKTTRNDNSSRFGKYTEISFDRKYRIMGANMRTYLLEKSRVVFQAEKERNYHIFYQMCSCADRPDFKDLRLLSAGQFQYTCMGGAVDGVADDRSAMEETLSTFSLLGLKEDFRRDVLKVLASILHLGNVAISHQGSDRSSVNPSDAHLSVFCELLGVRSPEALCRWLCHRRMVLRSETVVRPVGRAQAASARDALAKHLYAHLFEQVIARINGALRVPEAAHGHAFIGVLDIYGFETFDTNSFEQFCINYANEKLQQQFNLHVFKLEQEEYMREDIPWTLIDFYDNQPVIDLIEAKMGVLDLLDEECVFPQGTDQNWLQKLYNYLESNPLFEKPRLSNQAFLIQHFADKVEYQCRGFLEKNRDALYEELVDIMRASDFPLLANFFQDSDEQSQAINKQAFRVKAARPTPRPSNKHLRATVGEKFRGSLSLLMETLNATTPHYVRCIKPNDHKLPFEYDCRRVVQQLRACGVLETIHISAQSYPSRWTYTDFHSRYRVLMTKQELSLTDRKQACRAALERIIQDSNQYKFGRTKMFFRAGQLAYLEKFRVDLLRAACVRLQKAARGWLQRRRYRRMREAAIVLQQYVRGQRSIRKTVTPAALKRGWAALVIQTTWRRYRVQRIYQLVRLAAVTIQAFTRGWLDRRRYKKMVETQKVLVLQKHARAWLARRRFQTTRRLVINVQLAFRVQHLRKKLEEQNKENRGLVERLTSLASSHSHSTERVRHLEAALERTAGENTALAAQHHKTREDGSKVIAQLQQEKEQLIREKQSLEITFEASIKENKDDFEKIKRNLQEEKEKEERLRKVAENNMDLQRRDGDSQTDLLRDELRRSKEERVRLQRLLDDGGRLTSDLQEQVLQLSKHVKVIPELRRELHNLQSQSNDTERRRRQQSEHTRAKMNEIIRTMLGGVGVEEELLSRLTADDPDKIYDVEDMVTACDNIQHATSVLQRHQKEQADGHERQAEVLSRKVEHLNKENLHLQRLFQEKSHLHEEVHLEITRLTQENAVIPELQQSVSELHRHKQEVELQNRELADKTDEISNTLQKKVEEHRLQSRASEQQAEDLKEAMQRLQDELEELRDSNQRLSGHKVSHAQELSRLSEEAVRLTAHSMDMEEQLDMKDRLIKKLNHQIKSLETLEKDKQAAAAALAAPKEYLGMLEFNREDEARIIQNIILELKPRGVVVNMLPGLPAHILFMCVRHADYLNDGAKLKSLMNAVISGVKRVVLDHHKDFEMLSFWMSNMYCLLNCLKQYSGEEEFTKQNTSRQNQNCLQNFDLSEHRQILSDLNIHIYHQFISVLDKTLTPMIVPGMLEHESLQGVSSMKPPCFRKRSSSGGGGGACEAGDKVFTMASVLGQLSLSHSTMLQHAMERTLLAQAVKQMFFLIGALTLNNVLLRKDMSSCRKGMQIRCNISYLEEWLKDKELQSSGAMDTLKPLSQAAWLLQVSKSSDDDAKEIVETCSELNPVQIVKILNSYTPIDDFEKKVAPSFVRKVQSLLQDQEDRSAQLMLDARYRFQVTFPFCPSAQPLELLQVPASLRLGFLTRV